MLCVVMYMFNSTDRLQASRRCCCSRATRSHRHTHKHKYEQFKKKKNNLRTTSLGWMMRYNWLVCALCVSSGFLLFSLWLSKLTPCVFQMVYLFEFDFSFHFILLTTCVLTKHTTKMIKCFKNIQWTFLQSSAVRTIRGMILNKQENVLP